MLSNFVLAAIRTPGIVASILGNFVMTCALLLADVATDTLCVERAKLETDDTRGTLQSSGYTYRAIGMILGMQRVYTAIFLSLRVSLEVLIWTC